jgi:SAM-dependent methyltransferase
VAPGNSPVDIAERGGLAKIGSFVAMDNYAPISSAVADASLDLVTCYIGLHHSPLDRLDAFVQSIVRVLRPGGVFVLRDHDVVNAQMNDFVSLVHTVFNAGLNETWETNTLELRHFRSVAYWVDYLQARGLQDMGLRLLQANDPSDNVLMGFVKGTGKAVV